MMHREKFLYWFCAFSALYHFTSRVGMSIDIQWHTDVGRDEFLTPPHVMVLAGLPICIFLCLYYILSSKKIRQELVVENDTEYNFFGFYAPIEIWFTLVGMLTIIVGAFYDNYWHAQFGVDTTIVTPPHMLTLSGGMVAEFSAILLIHRYLKESGKKFDGIMTVSLLLLLWTLLFHLSFASLNFMDSRYVFTEVFGFNIMLHFFIAPVILFFMIKLCKDFFGELKLIQFGLATLAIHVFLLVMNPIFVDLLMNEGHVYRPGAPTPVWSAHSVTWLFLPLCLLNVKFNLTEKPLIFIPMLLASDVLFSPFTPQFFAFEKGIPTLVANIILAYVFTHLMARIATIYLDDLAGSEAKSRRLSLNLTPVIAVLMILLVSPVSAHHPTFIPGNGLDAPMRVQTHLDDTIVEVEFMLWPPKAPQHCEIMLLATESEKNVESLWIEILYEDELDDVIMIQDFEKFTGQDIWLGDVRFSFSGNQTIIVKGIIDGELKQDSFQIEVEEPTTVPVWLGWLISTLWASGLVYLPWRFAKRSES